MSSPSRSSGLHRRYEFEYDVGEWTYGTVQVVKDRGTGGLKTCKSVQKLMLQDPEETAVRLRKLCKLHLPHVNSITDVVEDAEHIFILSDRCHGGDLNVWLEQLGEHHWLQEDIVAAYVGQALVALAHSHAKHVYHHDLTPSSILLTSRLPDATVMVGDFGVQAVLDPDSRIARLNPNSYMAPELVSDMGRVLGGGAPDVWSLGAIAQLLLVGREPLKQSFYSGSILGNVRSGDEWSDRSAASKDFVQRLLQPAGHRPTAANMLQHPWLRHTIIPRVIRGRPSHEDVQVRIECYMVAVLLVPAQLLHGDFCKLMATFKRFDGDYDGLVLQSVAQQILQEHSADETTVDNFTLESIEDALEIADVKGTGIFDLCGTAVAAMCAKRLPRRSRGSQPSVPSRAAELLPRLVERFFEVYAKAHQTQLEVSRLLHQLRNATGREFEQNGGVNYDEMLAAFSEYIAIDRDVLTMALSLHVGRGTPISYAQDTSEVATSEVSSEGSCEALEGFNGFIGKAMETCGFLPETRRMIKKFLDTAMQDIHCVQCIAAR